MMEDEKNHAPALRQPVPEPGRLGLVEAAAMAPYSIVSIPRMRPESPRSHIDGAVRPEFRKPKHCGGCVTPTRMDAGQRLDRILERPGTGRRCRFRRGRPSPAKGRQRTVRTRDFSTRSSRLRFISSGFPGSAEMNVRDLGYEHRATGRRPAGAPPVGVDVAPATAGCTGTTVDSQRCPLARSRSTCGRPG